MQRACPLEPAFAWSATASLAPLISVKGALTRGNREGRTLHVRVVVWELHYGGEEAQSGGWLSAAQLPAAGCAWPGEAWPASRVPAERLHPLFVTLRFCMRCKLSLLSGALLRPCPQAATATSTAAASAAGSCGARCLQPRAGGGRWTRASVCAGWQVGGWDACMCAWVDGWAGRRVADFGWRRLLGCGIGLLGGADCDVHHGRQVGHCPTQVYTSLSRHC